MLKKLHFIVLLALTYSIANSQTTQIMACNDHSIVKCDNGTIKVFGSNLLGQLGLNEGPNSKRLPETNPTLTNVINFSGRDHSIFVKNDGTAWVCGSNLRGELGGGFVGGNMSELVQVPLSNISAASAGQSFSLFLKGDGTVWSCGENNYGQLGLGYTGNLAPSPTQIPSLNGITAISAGYNHSLFLKNDGTVWACGTNFYGQLGEGTNNDSNIPVQITSLSNVVAISAGGAFSLFLKNDGTVWACGNNIMGQLGLEDLEQLSIPGKIPALNGITGISAGNAHSLFLKNDGTVWACGMSTHGQLGITPLWWGSPEIKQVPNLSSITAISAGAYHSLFLKNDGTLITTGNNKYGQVGNGSAKTEVYPPVSLGSLSTCFVATPPQVDFSNFPSSLCLGGNVISEPSISGSNPMIGGGVDSSIVVNAPKAICRNNAAIFVLEANDQIKRFDFSGNLQLTYNAGGALLGSITAMTADDSNNVWVSSSSTPDRIYRIGIANDTSHIQSYYISTTQNSMAFFNYNYTPGNLFMTGNDGNLVSIDQTNSDPFSNSTLQAGISLNGNPVTSITCDNISYAEKRMIFTDPLSNKIWARKLFDANASNLDEKLLIDSTLTQGFAFDYVWADTTRSYYNILTSSSTTGTIGLITNSKNDDGTFYTQIDTLLGGLVNSQMPVGIVSVPFGNLPEYWIADKSKNKVLRVRLYVYELIPELPEGLKFNTFTGKIEGTPVNASGIQTYQVIIHNSLGTDTSTFTFAVNPTSNVSNSVGSSSASGQVNDGLSIKYFENNSCSRLLEIADSIGGTSPGHTNITQTTYPLVGVIANDSLIRRVNSVRADNMDSLIVNVKLFYTFEDIQLFNQTRGSVLLSNDTIGGTMQMAVLQMHDKPDGSKEPIIHSPVTATWSTANQHWAATIPVTKFSEFYGSDTGTLTTFDCTNNGAETLTIPNSFYVWHSDSLFTTGTYTDTLINSTGCDSIATLNLTLSPTGLTESASSNSIHLFPNPSNGILNITFTGNAVTPDRVRIMNILGNEVYNEVVRGNTQIDITSFNCGIYIVSIDTKDQTFVYRIIKE